MVHMYYMFPFELAFEGPADCREGAISLGCAPAEPTPRARRMSSSPGSKAAVQASNFRRTEGLLPGGSGNDTASFLQHQKLISRNRLELFFEAVWPANFDIGDLFSP
jgi:hypothetical protein